MNILLCTYCGASFREDIDHECPEEKKGKQSPVSPNPVNHALQENRNTQNNNDNSNVNPEEIKKCRCTCHPWNKGFSLSSIIRCEHCAPLVEDKHPLSKPSENERKVVSSMQSVEDKQCKCKRDKDGYIINVRECPKHMPPVAHSSIQEKPVTGMPEQASRSNLDQDLGQPRVADTTPWETKLLYFMSVDDIDDLVAFIKANFIPLKELEEEIRALITDEETHAHYNMECPMCDYNGGVEDVLKLITNKTKA